MFTDWNIEEMTGYKPKTTFYQDFSIADIFGVKSIRHTFKTAFEEWKGNYSYLTELVMALNWKIWERYGRNDKYAELYNELWAAAYAYAVENLRGEELSYFYATTD